MIVINDSKIGRKGKIHDLEEFLEIEDKDLQKYLYVSQLVRERDYQVKITDNDEKFCIYKIEKSLKVNGINQAFYIKSNLLEWISYDRKTKKIKVSNNCREVVDRLLQMRFGDNAEIVRQFITKYTGTICKNIILGKIKTIGDILDYHKSYTIKDKTLSRSTVYDAAINDSLYLIRVFKDPNSANFEELKTKIQSKPYNSENNWSVGKMIAVKPVKIESDEIDRILTRYDEWYNEASIKYAKIKGNKHEEDGSDNCEDTSSEIPDFLAEDLYGSRKM